uniref:Uncharacterized protein n=1 Tax=Arundo donax TaxID=35708 RepID=A0A0A9BDM6_ARUDO
MFCNFCSIFLWGVSFYNILSIQEIKSAALAVFLLSTSSLKEVK